ncbi:MAG TPA: hypothetical protein VF614_04805 [Chthoniobacteraceae bacterium]|jgi:hypothetical protein
MALNTRGIQPLAWGTTVTTGYVTETQGEDDSTEELIIDDEAGDVATHITGFGLKTDVNLDVIPKSTITTPPVAGDIFSYGPTGSVKKCVIITISKKRVKKDVEKWSIKGVRHPNITLT